MRSPVASGAEQAYEGFVADQEGAFLDELAAVAPDAQVGQSLRTVYGGVALTVPANTIDESLALADVVAVQKDQLRQLLTDSSPDFIGADSLYPELGGDNAGRHRGHLRRARHRRLARAPVVRRTRATCLGAAER